MCMAVSAHMYWVFVVVTSIEVRFMSKGDQSLMTSLPLCTSGWGWLLFITSLVVFVLVNFLLYFLYFPLMISVLSVSTVTARVSSHRFPSNGKLCTHGIIFEWPPTPLPPNKDKVHPIHTQKYNLSVLDPAGFDRKDLIGSSCDWLWSWRIKCWLEKPMAFDRMAFQTLSVTLR